MWEAATAIFDLAKRVFGKHSNKVLALAAVLVIGWYSKGIETSVITFKNQMNDLQIGQASQTVKLDSMQVQLNRQTQISLILINKFNLTLPAVAKNSEMNTLADNFFYRIYLPE